MTDRSGCGPLHLAVLQAIDTCGARSADGGTSAIPVRIAITLIPGTDPVTARDQLAVT